MKTSRPVWASIVAGSVLFFIIALCIQAAGWLGLEGYAAALPLAVLGFGFLVRMQKEEGKGVVLFGGVLALIFVYITLATPYFATAVLSLLMLSFPLYWLSRQGVGTYSALMKLGMKSKSIWRDALRALFLTITIVLLLIILSRIYLALGIADAGNVVQIIKGVPLYVIVLAVIIAPFTEEIFFRGFLVPRIGVLPSAVLFSLSHLAYGSVVEALNVFMVGLVYGTYFKQNRSLAPLMLSHVIINGVAVYVITQVL